MANDGTAVPRDCLWEVDGLQLAGLVWGPQDGTPVLMLHGWMDHAASFLELAPRLTGCHVVAIDLSGQGLSGHRARHATYNIWDDLPQIAGLLDLLGWKRCVLVGHSRGANIGALFAAALPERVCAFVALDSLIPVPTDEIAVSTLRAFLNDTRAQINRPPRTFATRAEYIERRVAQGNSRKVSEALADRALENGPDGYRMRGDPRLFASSAVKLTQTDVESVLRSIQCPVLNVWAIAGIRSRLPRFDDLVRRCAYLIPNYETLELAGDHHFHLDPTTAAQIASAILGFLDRHRVGAL